MEIPERVAEIAGLLREKGFSPVGFAEQDDIYVVQIAEQG